MSKETSIFLIGPMGAGKTSVAQHLSDLMRWPFYDSDQEIEKRTGVSISWIFSVEQESGFRKREAEMIDLLSQMKNIVLSTGGGSVVTPINCERLKNRGFVAYLTVNLELQYERTKRHRGHRPLIDYPDAKERLLKLNAEREPLYLSIADKIYCTDHDNPRDIAGKILNDFRIYSNA